MTFFFIHDIFLKFYLFIQVGKKGIRKDRSVQKVTLKYRQTKY